MPGTIVLEAPGGAVRAVQPVESDRSVSSYYDHDGANSDSSATPDGLERSDATVSFLYRNSATGVFSLLKLNGGATSSTDGGGRVPTECPGVSGCRWQAQDGPPGEGDFGDQDPCSTGSDQLDESARVIRGWNDDRTDGGAFGPLGATGESTATGG